MSGASFLSRDSMQLANALVYSMVQADWEEMPSASASYSGPLQAAMLLSTQHRAKERPEGMNCLRRKRSCLTQ